MVQYHDMCSFGVNLLTGVLVLGYHDVRSNDQTIDWNYVWQTSIAKH